LLEKVNLPDLAARFDGLDAELDWAKVLSVGEQQRVAFARVLLSAPRYAILDEATSALDIANEDSLYQQLAASDTTLDQRRSPSLDPEVSPAGAGADGRWRMAVVCGWRLQL
jgi:ABC-type glutathione transport system ATPase component